MRLGKFLPTLVSCLLFSAVALEQAFPQVAKVYVLPLRDEVEQSMVYLARRAVKEANAAKADALILHLDTNGGRSDSMEAIMQAVLKFHRPDRVYAYVDTKAISAGALIASAARHIYMAPGSVIGGATPVMLNQSGSGVQEIPASYEQKILSVYRAMGRAVAERNGYQPAVFEAMIDPKAGLVINGEKVPAKAEGRVLTLTSNEAARAYGRPPQPLLSSGTVESLGVLARQIAGPQAQLITVEPTGFEQLARLLTMISPLLLTAGLVLGYVEFKTPGTWVFGAAAAACFALYFFGYHIAGLSGYGPAIAFALGMGLILFEVLLFPGVLLPILLGLILAFGALLLAMVDRYPQDALIPASNALGWPLLELTVSLLASLGIMALLARYLPERAFAGGLAEATIRGAGYGPQPIAPVRVSQEGVALTLLRPSGTARFGETPVDVVTEGEFIEAGATIIVSAIEGARIVVKAK